MRRHDWIRRGVGSAALLWAGLAWAQPGPTPAPTAVSTPGVATTAAVPLLPPEVQIVRFQGPPGVRVEVLGPPPEGVPVGDGHGLATVGLRVGVGYQLRLSNLPDRPGVELFPYVELVGHLHRPPGVDPAKFPIRVQFTLDDFDDVIDRSRLVTQVVYLEDPEQALPMPLPKDEIPVVSLSPVEPPIKVASALGRVMAIVRIGTRAGTEDTDRGDDFQRVRPAAGDPLGRPLSVHGPGGGALHASQRAGVRIAPGGGPALAAQGRVPLRWRRLRRTGRRHSQRADGHRSPRRRPDVPPRDRRRSATRDRQDRERAGGAAAAPRPPGDQRERL